MAKSICSIDGCTALVHGRALCPKHYRRWQRGGDPSKVLKVQHLGDVQERFWAKVEKTEGCWIWRGAISASGYGNYCAEGKFTNAHRFAYKTSVDFPVPDDVHIDHQCHNKACVRPGHLRMATPLQNKENFRPGDAQSRSGIRGVSWDAQRRMWRARVQHKGKCV